MNTVQHADLLKNTVFDGVFDQDNHEIRLYGQQKGARDT